MDNDSLKSLVKKEKIQINDRLSYIDEEDAKIRKE